MPHRTIYLTISTTKTHLCSGFISINNNNGLNSNNNHNNQQQQQQQQQNYYGQEMGDMEMNQMQNYAQQNNVHHQQYPVNNHVPQQPTEVQNGPVQQPMQNHESQPEINNHNEDLKTESDDKKVAQIKLNRLSKDDQEMMQKSIKAFANENPNKAEDMGVNERAPVVLKIKKQAESDDDEDEEVKKSKNKFFKASEKERDEKQRELRKRKAEDIQFVDVEMLGKRRKAEPEEPEEEVEEKAFVPKKVTRKVERKLIPMLMKINAEELMDSNMFQRFNKTVELIFENMEEVNMQEFEDAEKTGENGQVPELPPEILIPKYQLQDLSAETAKLKSQGAMESIPSEKVVKLLNILELNIRDGSKVIPLPTNSEDDDEEQDEMWLELAMERVTRAADASLTVLHILTSKNMHKCVYNEDVIDRVAMFLRFQLANTIYPSYDPVYKEFSKNKNAYMGGMKKKRSHAHQVRDKNIINLYSKCRELTDLLGDLVKITLLTDTTVLHISTIGVAPFFVESIPELQLAALKLVTNVFSKYEKHRKLLLDDILASIARLPSSKRSLRTYRLNATTHIQMLTALVLQLIQCVVILPKTLTLGKNNKELSQSKVIELDGAVQPPNPDMDRDVLINERYSAAMATAYQFLTVFLKKCGSKSEDIDYRPLFENFVQDLLTTVNTPEWPAAELLLSFLGRVLRDKFCDRGTEMALRISSLEYLGVVAARLRKDAVQSKMKVDYIDSIINIIKSEEEKDKADAELDPVEEYFRKQEQKKGGKSNKKKQDDTNDPERERTLFLQRVLLDYLAVSAGDDDQSILNARHFYISQWYRDANAEATKKPQKTPKKKRKRSSSSSEESSDESDDDEDVANGGPIDPKRMEMMKICEAHKKFLVTKILPFGVNRGQKASVLSTHIDHSSAQLIVRYLSSKRPFANSFNQYLTDILKVLNEQSTHVRTKALKCVTMIVTEDPDVLLRPDMAAAVQSSFVDTSTMAREAAIDLVGKFILSNEDLISKYYDAITGRILDTGVSVRKRVIKIFKEICMEYPGYPKIPEICVMMIRRINDEEGIRKLVMEVFQNMWFIPIRERNRTPQDTEFLVTRCRNITDVVIASKDTGLEWFEQLLENMFRPKEDKDDATKKAVDASPTLVLACQQIVDCLVESVLQMEESSSASDEEKKRSSRRVSACLTTLFIFSKTRPTLLVDHAQTLQPYLSITCNTPSDFQIVSDVARTLELTVPLIKHPSEIFLSQLEEDAVKLILTHEKKVIRACLSCLGSIVNDVTKNFKLIRDCFKKYYFFMTSYRKAHETNPSDPRLGYPDNLSKFRRGLFTVGLLLMHFDFSSPDLYSELEVSRLLVRGFFSNFNGIFFSNVCSTARIP